MMNSARSARRGRSGGSPTSGEGGDGRSAEVNDSMASRATTRPRSKGPGSDVACAGSEVSRAAAQAACLQPPASLILTRGRLPGIGSEWSGSAGGEGDAQADLPGVRRDSGNKESKHPAAVRGSLGNKWFSQRQKQCRARRLAAVVQSSSNPAYDEADMGGGGCAGRREHTSQESHLKGLGHGLQLVGGGRVSPACPGHRYPCRASVWTPADPEQAMG